MRPAQKAPSLYDADYLAWLEQQAAALRTRRWSDVDVGNLAEEIDDLGKSQRRELRSRLKVLLQHLFKIRHQPEKETGSWDAAIRDQRFEITQLLEDSPSLRQMLPEAVERVYPTARRGAAHDTGLALEAFPRDCPFSIEEILKSAE